MIRYNNYNEQKQCSKQQAAGSIIISESIVSQFFQGIYIVIAQNLLQLESSHRGIFGYYDENLLSRKKVCFGE